MKRILLLFIVFSYLTGFSDGYKIKIKIKGISDTTAYLGHYLADNKYAIDTISLNKNGIGIFEGDSALKAGMYMVLFPSVGMKYFDLLIDENQNFSLETDTIGFTENMKIKGDKQNEAFYIWSNYIREQNEKNISLQKELKDLKNKAKQAEKVRNKLIANEKIIKNHLKELATEWDGTLFGILIKSMIEPIMPNIEIANYITNKDSATQIMQYLWRKEHYFDNIDIKDNRLIRTPFFLPRINSFMTKLVVQQADSIVKEGTKLIEASRGSDNFAYLVRYMFGYKDKSKLMGMDKVFVEISEKYYLSNDPDVNWPDSAFIEKIRERVVKEKPNLIGNLAPKLNKLETYEKQFINLYEINNDYTIIIFWEPNCGHCKKIVPKLYKSFLQMRKDKLDVQVLAMYTHLERKSWEEFIEEKEIFDWINAYDKYYFTNFKNNYDIYSTPTIYLLDKDKKIIGKRLVIEQVEQIIYGMEGKKAPNHEKK